jgi:hypothetical protein
MNSKSPLLTLFKEQLENESQQIASDNGLAERGDYLIWWYFHRLLDIPFSEIDAIVCDGGNDLGIDAIRIDEEAIVHFYQFKNPQKVENSLPGGEVDKMLSGLSLILTRKHNSVANADLRARIDETYKIIPNGYRIHLVTSGCGMAEETRVKLDAFIEGLKSPSDDFFTWKLEDLEALQEKFYQRNLPTVEEPLVFVLERQPPYQIRSSNHDCYLLHATGSALAALYESHGEQLLQQNIRVFQGDRTTNALIRQTASSENSGNFFHYNNGVTFLCETAQWDQFQAKLTLNRAQIVNGGQTVRVLSRTKKANALKKDVLVPVRVITSQGDRQFASDVAVNLNNQNRIESSFLRSNEPRVVQLALAMESLGWYLERRENEVENLTEAEKKAIELRVGASLENRMVTLREGTQAYVATYFRQPELAKKNPKRMFLGAQDGGVFERVFGQDITAEKMIAAFRLKRVTDRFVSNFLSLKRRKERNTLDDWRKEYKALLGQTLVDDFADTLDQAIPQSAVFLSALVFEEHVRLKSEPFSSLLSQLESGDLGPLQQGLFTILTFSKNNEGSANKSWPTLLKSQSLFENVSSFRKGQLSCS